MPRKPCPFERMHALKLCCTRGTSKINSVRSRVQVGRQLATRLEKHDRPCPSEAPAAEEKPVGFAGKPAPPFTAAEVLEPKTPVEVGHPYGSMFISHFDSVCMSTEKDDAHGIIEVAHFCADNLVPNERASGQRPLWRKNAGSSRVCLCVCVYVCVDV